MPPAADAKSKSKSEGEKEPLSVTLKAAAKRALGGGLAGAMAMVLQVVLLMWMRTTINFQHANGMSTTEAITALYAQGGIGRFYQGVYAALLQAPLSRFGDTASNAGAMALLDATSLPAGVKTFFASCAAALFRIGITPIDAFKTTLQVQGAAGLAILQAKIASDGFSVLYAGAVATSLATFAGHYPWFITFNFLNAKVPSNSKTNLGKNTRSACIGFVCQLVSDVVSNSIRVVKTAKQTAPTAISYAATVAAIVEADGMQGLFLRGLSTKLISNGVSAMLFTVLWRYFDELLAGKKDKAKKA